MIPRLLAHDILDAARFFPVIAILGPRQSGKTTLARATFPDHGYISLEDFDNRQYAAQDPRGFLANYARGSGLILDEFQHTPEILSYIQTMVDEQKQQGFFVLTGSQNFLMNDAISQSLAGRISIHTLLPLSLQELQKAGKMPPSIPQALYQGNYPSLYNQEVSPERWYRNYLQTYIERDVRSLKQITDLNLFQTFIQLCAGRVGQLVNLTSLGNDCGISANTARDWLSILQASYILFFLQPHHKNFNKRLIKSPKLYFYDTGLVCSLLKIPEEQVPTHYLKGALFESMVISELVKYHHNTGSTPRLFFWRDQAGHEIDCLLEHGQYIVPVEIKTSMTASADYFAELQYYKQLAHETVKNNYVVYGGTQLQQRTQGTLVGWQNIDYIFTQPPFKSV